jgi:hypothetical protein
MHHALKTLRFLVDVKGAGALDVRFQTPGSIDV